MIVKVPLVGEGVEELTLVRWFASEGDAVERGAPLAELESDKVVTEFESPASGRLVRISAAPGDRVRAGAGIAEIEEGASTAAQEAGAGQAGAAPRPEPAAGTVPEPAGDPATEAAAPPRFVSPLARRLAELHGVDTAAVRGSGLGGRVVKQDILDYVEQRNAQGAEAARTGTELTQGEPPSGSSAAARSAPRTSGEVRGELLPHSPVRRRIAERVIQSLHSTAAVLTVMEADLGAVLAHREANREAFAADGLRLTLTAYFIAAAAAALRTNPAMNAAWTDEGLLIRRDVNVGIAVSLGEAGLLAPVIRRADELSLRGLAAAVQDLSSRARNGGLQGEDLRGGTFTVTNHGTAGSLFATPIMLQDQVGILGVGAVTKRAAVVRTADGSDALAVRPLAFLSLVFDHRAMDGEGADTFLSAVKAHLEGWR